MPVFCSIARMKNKKKYIHKVKKGILKGVMRMVMLNSILALSYIKEIHVAKFHFDSNSLQLCNVHNSVNL